MHLKHLKQLFLHREIKT